MDSDVSRDTDVVSLLNDLADIMIVNLLWVITSIPFITLGASTTAMYCAMRSPGENRYASSIFLLYFSAFARNFKKATGIFLLLLIPGALVAVNAVVLFGGFLAESMVGYFVCSLSLVLFFSLWIYVFPLTATFDNGILKTVANALTLSVAHFPTTVLVMALSLIPVLVLLLFTNFFFKTVFIWVFLVLALIAKANAYLVERVLRRYIPTQG